MKIFDKLKDSINNGKLLIFLLCLSLPFTHIPLYLQKVNILVGGYFSLKLLIYPILLIMLYVIYKRKEFKYDKKILYYLWISVILYLISLLYALVIYPYGNEINLTGDIPKIVACIANLFDFNDNQIYMLWLVGRLLRSFFIYTIFTIGISCLLYLIFKNIKFNEFEIIILSIKIIILLMILYSFWEILYFMDFKIAKDVLTTINPYIHTIQTNYDWWPQLLLRNQLRSFFVEPSYLAMYGAVALPFLWSCLYARQSKNDIVINIIFITSLTFFMFLTKSRMATAFMILDITLLVMFTVYYYKKMIKNTFIILICTLIAFFGAILFSEKYMSSNNNINVNSNFKEYIDNNVKSIASINERSNGTRYGVMYADFLIGKNNLLFGVGEVLRNRYMLDYLPDWSLEKNETKMWVNAVKEKGILQSGFPNLNEYLYRFSTTGLLGLSVFLFPIFLLMIKLFNVFRFNKYFNVNFVFFTIAFIASCATGVGDSVTRIYWFWILLPLGYVMCFRKENDVKDNGDTGSRQEH